MSDAQASGSNILRARLGIGLAQGLGLWWMIAAATKPLGIPATVHWLFEPLLLLMYFVPLLANLGLGKIPRRSLTLWLGIAALAIFLLGLHDATRGRVFLFNNYVSGLWPWLRLIWALITGLFVAHVLVVDQIIERRFIPTYSRHFETAWKQAFQLVFAAIFLGVFWGVLYLGSALFELIGLNFFHKLIVHEWFSLPASTLIISAAIHLTDVKPALLHGVRVVVLTLFSWLLPLLAVILLGFLASIPFISLNKLWATHFAAQLLLGAAGMLVFLINTCYQDGANEITSNKIKRYCCVLAAHELVPLTALAFVAIEMRVRQYGWSVGRIDAAAIAIIAACYATGYVVACYRSPTWMKRLEIANHATAYVFLILTVALCSPIADPARLMVADQVARLKSGTIAADKFDFVSLRLNGAKWGATALQELRSSPIIEKSAIAQNHLKNAIAVRGYLAAANQAVILNPAEISDLITVHPNGRSLPPDFITFLSQVTGVNRPYCLNSTSQNCVANYVSDSSGNTSSILFLDNNNGFTLRVFLYTQDSNKNWQLTGTLNGPSIYCPALRTALDNGQFSVSTDSLPVLVVGNRHLAMSPPSQACQ